MSTVFVGGSRHISHLPQAVIERLQNMIQNRCSIVVGDANGADKSLQTFFNQAGYRQVTVFCSGPNPRNNVGDWQTHPVSAAKAAKGFQFHAVKDREMALAADVGYMIWDGKSPGTILNALRLIRAGKIALVFNASDQSTLKLKIDEDWQYFLSACNEDLQHDLRSRATPEEWNTPIPDARVLV